MTQTSSRPPATALSWAILAAVVASLVFVSLMIGPMFAGIAGFWLVGAWAAFWLIRLAVRYGVSDALQAHRAAQDPERSELTR
ncbi:hypothetical protein GCM10009623_24010 [Nocardioides aestuarii]|uniref:Uncharacterized protein n=1 Tax=Nocardioides aestuarii TaxID=252231 RepID=A0ABW4TM50_9ACTN